jgi:hypothetical protein
VKVTDLEGRTWTIRRQWLPRYEGRGLRERLRRKKTQSQVESSSQGKSRWWDYIDVPFVDLFDDSLVTALIVVAAVGVLLVLLLFGVPFILALVDLVVVLLVAVVGVVSRVLFRRPWTVEARSSTGEHHEGRVVGWRRSGALMREMGVELQHGRPPASPSPRA